MREELQDQRPKPIEKIVIVTISDDRAKFLNLESAFKDPIKTNIVKFLKQKLDVLAWSAANMPSVNFGNHLQTQSRLKTNQAKEVEHRS